MWWASFVSTHLCWWLPVSHWSHTAVQLRCHQRVKDCLTVNGGRAIKFAVCLFVCLSVVFSVCSGHISCEAAERIRLKKNVTRKISPGHCVSHFSGTYLAVLCRRASEEWHVEACLLTRTHIWQQGSQSRPPPPPPYCTRLATSAAVNRNNQRNLAWFLRLGAPLFCQPICQPIKSLAIARLFNLPSLPLLYHSSGSKPSPGLKVPAPSSTVTLEWPISITPVLIPIMEKKQLSSSSSILPFSRHHHVETRAAEIDNIERWAQRNNQGQPLSTDGLSASDHDHEPMCADSIRAARVLSTRLASGGAADHLPVSRNCQATLCINCAEWTYQSDWSATSWRISTSQRPPWYSPNVHTFVKLCAAADVPYFKKKCSNSNHILHRLLPPVAAASQNYNLRPPMHNLRLPQHSSRLIDSNFIIRMICTDIY